MDARPPLTQASSPPVADAALYRQVVGALQYLTLTRPDIAFSVNRLCQFMHNPNEDHWKAAKRLLKYLKYTSSDGLLFSKTSSTTLQCFTDSDWGGCLDDRRSMNGYAIYLGNNLISWASKKQPTIARSSTESEYKALANSAAEVVWLTSLLGELGFTPATPPILWCDNIGAIYLSKNPVFHARTKHVELDYHFVRELVSQQKLQIQFLKGSDQTADILTKPLGTALFDHHKSKLRLLSISSSA
ncbi:hypothetical protein K2173_020141 [Erythroxylum novogranatense]|uniref:Uncharacterized protein n=1 Tax=Erythroxylum novogranatense TaxID=1862640 RepID=A0AAV8U758_9ROSI|nr:hypothetical protein K2173_020141 [Erythroxylum novogranatense]